jgi:glucose-6-phosphate isomerase
LLELDYINVLESAVHAHGIFSEYFTAYAREFYDIDAFDQPGVEYGKKLNFAMMGGPGFGEYHRKIEEIRQRGRSVIR